MDPQAIFENFRRTVTEHYFDLNGRVGRAQFWYFVLANIVIAIALSFVQAVVFLPLAALYNLAMLLPSAGMGARRLLALQGAAARLEDEGLPLEDPDVGDRVLEGRRFRAPLADVFHLRSPSYP